MRIIGLLVRILCVWFACWYESYAFDYSVLKIPMHMIDVLVQFLCIWLACGAQLLKFDDLPMSMPKFSWFKWWMNLQIAWTQIILQQTKWTAFSSSQIAPATTNSPLPPRQIQICSHTRKDFLLYIITWFYSLKVLISKFLWQGKLVKYIFL